MTTRGFNTEDMQQVGQAIGHCLCGGEAGRQQAAAIVAQLTSKYPLYQ